LFNKVILAGHIGQDPSLKKTSTGKSVAYANLATNSFRNRPNGEKIKDTAWHPLAFYGKTAEIVMDHVRKGSALLVEGHLNYYDYKPKNGESINYPPKQVSIIVDKISFIGPKPGNGGAVATNGTANGSNVTTYDDDDIPF